MIICFMIICMFLVICMLFIVKWIGMLYRFLVLLLLQLRMVQESMFIFLVCFSVCRMLFELLLFDSMISRLFGCVCMVSCLEQMWLQLMLLVRQVSMVVLVDSVEICMLLFVCLVMLYRKLLVRWMVLLVLLLLLYRKIWWFLSQYFCMVCVRWFMLFQFEFVSIVCRWVV